MRRGEFSFAALLTLILSVNLVRLFFYNTWIVRRVLGGESTQPAYTAFTDMGNHGIPLAIIGLFTLYVLSMLTIQRLRALQLPIALVTLNIIPAVNFLFWVILGVLPEPLPQGAPAQPESFLSRLIPQSKLGSAAFCALVTALLGGILIWFGVAWLKSYSWGVFLVVPFLMGVISSLLYSYHRRRKFLATLIVSWASAGFLMVTLLGVAIEGAICLAMAAPLMLLIGTLGAIFGYFIQRRLWSRRELPLVLGAALAATVCFMGAEPVFLPGPPQMVVRTAIIVNASPEAIWPNAVATPPMARPTALPFRVGISYPVRARMVGQGLGATRYCYFPSGPIHETITHWAYPRVFRFRVDEQPDLMTESTPYGHFHSAHLDEHYMTSDAGQFEMTPLPDGRTRVTATSWYSHRIWPAHYWRLWSDEIIHALHNHVLGHIKADSERAAG